MLNEVRIYWSSIVVLVIGYLAYAGIIAHGILYPEMYQGLNFLVMLEPIYFVALIWLVCGFISGSGFGILWYRGTRNWKINLLLLLSSIPLMVWVAELLASGI